ncbi:unnamed protein product [Rangifer tarandus platyrhynchus]|uniref:Uncharacterized protein n=1 Tax=Rangifer tarandus platyrhynchus TaxID=3082113 RepID=A0AC60A4K4_RANTA
MRQPWRTVHSGPERPEACRADLAPEAARDAPLHRTRLGLQTPRPPTHRRALSQQKSSPGPPLLGKRLGSLGVRSYRRPQPRQAAKMGPDRLPQQLLVGKLWVTAQLQGRNTVSS